MFYWVSLSESVCVCVSVSACVCLQCSSGSSFRRLGGTVVIRILTVESAELTSKPVSLVSMDSTVGAHREVKKGADVSLWLASSSYVQLE